MDDAKSNADDTEDFGGLSRWLDLSPGDFISSVVGEILNDLQSLVLPIDVIVDQPQLAELLETPVLQDMTLLEVFSEMRGNAVHIHKILKLAYAYKEKLRQENKPSDTNSAE